MTSISPLKPEQLYQACDDSQFDFETTDDIRSLPEHLGQQRARQAVNFAVDIKHQGYNLYVLGPAGAGKRRFVKQTLIDSSLKKSLPNDLCYLNNFAEPNKPKTLVIATGKSRKLALDLENLVITLLDIIPAAFESEVYQNQLNRIEEDFTKKRDQALAQLRKDAQKQQIDFVRTPRGFTFVPMRDNKVLDANGFDQLAEAERNVIEKAVTELENQLQELFLLIPKWQQEAREQVFLINNQITNIAVESHIEKIKSDYPDYPQLQKHLDDIHKDVLDHAEVFRNPEELKRSAYPKISDHPFLRRYLVNVLVDNGPLRTAPIIDEVHPTHDNLIGKVEYESQMGTLLTDFTLIRAGSLHKANGGFLIIDAYKLLSEPYAWNALKRCLATNCINISSVSKSLGLISTVSLEPQEVRLDVKVILLGDRLTYHLLCEYDPEFLSLFKVAADLDDRIVRNDQNAQLYAKIIAKVCRDEELLPFHRRAVARIIEHSARLVEDAERLSTHMGDLSNLLHEAEYCAQQVSADVVDHTHVEEAIRHQHYRLGRVEEAYHDSIQRGNTLITTSGAAIGQVNGLSIIEFGQIMFGQPSRITATARIGDGKVIDIEHEADLGGEIHTKGVLILTHFLGARYSQERSLSLSASIVFEQSYGGVDGDSASTAELCALLSAIAKIPLKQSLAITGSVDQLGNIQTIGGVNEKIEGFFDVCRQRGLNGEHGVIIPHSNMKDLMLKRPVLEACEQGLFHIYAIHSIDQALHLLTGLDAGERNEDGEYAEGSVNEKVETALLEMADIVHPKSDDDEEEESEEEAKDENQTDSAELVKPEPTANSDAKKDQ